MNNKYFNTMLDNYYNIDMLDNSDVLATYHVKGGIDYDLIIEDNYYKIVKTIINNMKLVSSRETMYANKDFKQARKFFDNLD